VEYASPQLLSSRTIEAMQTIARKSKIFCSLISEDHWRRGRKSSFSTLAWIGNGQKKAPAKSWRKLP
jgi:hypothetical protein